MLKITRLAKNLSLSLMAEEVEFGSRKSDCKNKTVERLLFKNLNRAMGYLISDAR